MGQIVNLRRVANPPQLAKLPHANNARVAAWYASYGGLLLLDAPLSLLLPLTAVEPALQARK